MKLKSLMSRDLIMMTCLLTKEVTTVDSQIMTIKMEGKDREVDQNKIKSFNRNKTCQVKVEILNKAVRIYQSIS